MFACLFCFSKPQKAELKTLLKNDRKAKSELQHFGHINIAQKLSTPLVHRQRKLSNKTVMMSECQTRR